jgi:hypothetical protein
MVKPRWPASLALVLLLAAWRLHPIHAARVELDVSAAGNVTATVHVYRDDVPPGATIADVAACIDRGLVLADARGSRVVLRVLTVTPEGDRLRIALTGSAPAGIGHGRIAVPLLQERFADQVNVVDVRAPAGRTQLVFLQGDRPQVLP